MNTLLGINKINRQNTVMPGQAASSKLDDSFQLIPSDIPQQASTYVVVSDWLASTTYIICCCLLLLDRI